MPAATARARLNSSLGISPPTCELGPILGLTGARVWGPSCDSALGWNSAAGLQASRTTAGDRDLAPKQDLRCVPTDAENRDALRYTVHFIAGHPPARMHTVNEAGVLVPPNGSQGSM